MDKKVYIELQKDEFKLYNNNFDINDRKEHPIEIFLQLRKKNSLFICIFAPDFAKSE